MTQAEFERWQAFYIQQPFDDLHRYHRPAAIVSASMGGNFKDVVEMLVNDVSKPEISNADMNVFDALGVKPPKGWGEEGRL